MPNSLFDLHASYASLCEAVDPLERDNAVIDREIIAPFSPASIPPRKIGLHVKSSAFSSNFPLDCFGVNLDNNRNLVNTGSIARVDPVNPAH